MARGGRIMALVAVLAIGGITRARNRFAAGAAACASVAAGTSRIQLDDVVAIIGSSVLLQSDVEQETHLSALEPLQVLPGHNTPDSAIVRLIDRTLILQQMTAEQQQPITTPDAEVQKSLAELKKQIPACASFIVKQGRDGPNS